MGSNQQFLYKGQKLEKGDAVKVENGSSGAVDFYRVVRIWGSHLTMRVITELEAGPNAKTITVSADPQSGRIKQ